ncbi:unnamed protein product [Paramecium octaurelia]|uniref:Uncharacterized protein n=1 Tax=Paramecium octaurelia TaxID=43137 RepID=A0A8S1WRY5_PAROT|nr:unnamed protein product [Paramecium octaurelia]
MFQKKHLIRCLELLSNYANLYQNYVSLDLPIKINETKVPKSIERTVFTNLMKQLSLIFQIKVVFLLNQRSSKDFFDFQLIISYNKCNSNRQFVSIRYWNVKQSEGEAKDGLILLIQRQFQLQSIDNDE